MPVFRSAQAVLGGSQIVKRLCQCVLRSLDSLSRRAFSIAITAWAGEVYYQRVFSSTNGFTSSSEDRDRADQIVFLEHGYR